MLSFFFLPVPLVPCPDGWFYNFRNEMCYLPVWTSTGLDESQENCLSLGATMPSPVDEAEVLFITGLFAQGHWVRMGIKYSTGV